MGKFIKAGNTDVVALCDIYGAQTDRAKQDAPNARIFTDHRALLALKDVDVALIAVPDHWHAATATDALNAGKDVYVEKPLTLKMEEGPGIVKAARLNSRICQVGMQQRSGKHYLEAKRLYMDTGKLGKVTLARTWWHGNSYHLRKAPASLQTQPANLDWAHFLGPLKWRDWDPQQYWNWRAYLDFGGGQVTDLFTHWIDRGHAGSRHRGEWHRAVRHRGAAVDRPHALRIPPAGAERASHRGAGVERPGPGSRAELPGVRPLAQAAQRRRAVRAPLGAGVAPGESLVHAEAADRFRPGPRRDSAVLTACYTEVSKPQAPRSFMISATQLRPGMVIKFNNELYSIFSVNHRTPGNLRGFVQVRMRSLRSGSMTEHRFSSEDKVEKALLEEQEMQYLYDDGEYYYFMNTENFEQMHLMKDLLGDATEYLIPQLMVKVEFYEGKAMSVELPATVDLLVVETEPGMKGATVSNVTKPATLETGLVVQVPSFITEGEKIRVNTAEGTYQERA